VLEMDLHHGLGRVQSHSSFPVSVERMTSRQRKEDSRGC